MMTMVAAIPRPGIGTLRGRPSWLGKPMAGAVLRAVAPAPLVPTLPPGANARERPVLADLGTGARPGAGRSAHGRARRQVTPPSPLLTRGTPSALGHDTSVVSLTIERPGSPAVWEKRCRERLSRRPFRVIGWDEGGPERREFVIEYRNIGGVLLALVYIDIEPSEDGATTVRLRSDTVADNPLRALFRGMGEKATQKALARLCEDSQPRSACVIRERSDCRVARCQGQRDHIFGVFTSLGEVAALESPQLPVAGPNQQSDQLATAVNSAATSSA